MNVEKAFFRKLAFTEIAPSGWLKSQLSIQAGGLTGNLDKFWPDVKDSGWFGGKAEGWERAPYWLDGALPLAYLLKDEELISRVESYLDYIIDHQDEDGWLGSSEMNSKLGSNTTKESYDIWPQFLILKVLVQYHEAKPRERIFECVRKSLSRIHSHIDRHPLFNWAQFRWFEALMPIFWCWEREKADWLLDLAVKLKSQGFGWEELFAHWPYGGPTPKDRWSYMSHVVNNAMAVKSGALWSRLVHDGQGLKNLDSMISRLDSAHGTAVGTFSGDECLAGKDPAQGTELCAVVEYMYSLEEIIEITGDMKYADRLEKIAYNALPASFSDDMWNHQYDQQINQIECSVDAKWPWSTNGPDSNIFGLEPNFGCCTANMHQGWPKFARSLWLQDENENLFAVSYAPCEISKKIRGKKIGVVVESEYPFKDRVVIKATNPESCVFKIFLRLPSWADRMMAIKNGEKLNPEGGFFVADIAEPCANIEIRFNPATTLERRGGRRSCVTRGPLVFSLNVEASWKRVNDKPEFGEYSRGDWELRPLSKWNYAISENGLEAEEGPISDIPFSGAHPPVRVKVEGREVGNWGSSDGRIPDFPADPAFGQEESLSLIPYGCAKLRVTELPVVEETRGRPHE